MDQASIESINYWIGLAGTVAFAVTAVLAVAPRGIDIFGVLVMGVITAIGGGTLRGVITDGVADAVKRSARVHHGETIELG